MPSEDFVLLSHSTFKPFERYSDRLLDALWHIWKIKRPIDVAAFLKRCDIPERVKAYVLEAGKLSGRTYSTHSYRLMQAAVITAVAMLDVKK